MTFLQKNWPLAAAVGLFAIYAYVILTTGGNVWGERVQPAELPGYVVQVQIEYRDHTDVGSGALIAPDKVLTCFHNVRDMPIKRAKALRIKFPNGVVRECELGRVDRVNDLALLNIPPVLVQPVEPGDPVSKGDSVTIYGYPGGYVPAAVSGQVVGFAGHTIRGPQNVFVVNEAGGGGISGGPAIDSEGRLVGVMFGSADYSRVTGIEEVRRFLEK